MANALYVQANPQAYFSGNPLQPAIEQPGAVAVAIGTILGPSQTLAAGQVVGQQTTASVADVQTVSVSGGSGTMAFTLVTPLGNYVAAYNVTTAALQAALQLLYGAGNILVTGTAGTSYVLTGAGSLVAGPLPLIIIGTVSSGLTVTIAHTTVGILNGSMVPYSSAAVANPTTAPTLSDNATAGTWSSAASSTWSVAYTYVNAQGESIPSYSATIALATASHSIGIGSITGIPAGVTSVNVYVNGAFAFNQAVTSNATGAFVVTGPAASTAAHPAPSTSTAFTAADGSAIPIGVLKDPCTTDVFGNLTLGASSGTSTPANPMQALVYIKGFFRAEQLTGYDANAAAKLGRVILGTTTNGLIELT